MTFSRYGIKARMAPAIICAVPFLIFYYWYLSSASDMLAFLGKMKLASDLSFPVILTYLFSQINRHLSKTVFQRFYFKDELKMPTTDFLLYSDSQYTKDYKNDFRSKILSDFKMELPNEKEEVENESETRKRITEAMSLVRKKCEKSEMLLQHNMEYGFFRNLIGGSILSAPASFVFAAYAAHFHNSVAMYSLIACGIAFSLFLIFSKNLIFEHGNAYAKILFQEYTSMK